MPRAQSAGEYAVRLFRSLRDATRRVHEQHVKLSNKKTNHQFHVLSTERHRRLSAPSGGKAAKWWTEMFVLVLYSFLIASFMCGRSAICAPWWAGYLLVDRYFNNFNKTCIHLNIHVSMCLYWCFDHRLISGWWILNPHKGTVWQWGRRGPRLFSSLQTHLVAFRLIFSLRKTNQKLVQALLTQAGNFWYLLDAEQHELFCWNVTTLEGASCILRSGFCHDNSASWRSCWSDLVSISVHAPISRWPVGPEFTSNFCDDPFVGTSEVGPGDQKRFVDIFRQDCLLVHVALLTNRQTHWYGLVHVTTALC